jgi:hypothetical protein
MNHAHMKGSHFFDWGYLGWLVLSLIGGLLVACFLFFGARDLYRSNLNRPTVFQRVNTDNLYIRGERGEMIPTNKPEGKYDRVWFSPE